MTTLVTTRIALEAMRLLVQSSSGFESSCNLQWSFLWENS